MIIPKAFSIGPSRYEIKQVPMLTGPHSYGRIDFFGGIIYLASKNAFEIRYTHRQRSEAFWHETLHACMHDMGLPPAAHDEALIIALSKRIAQVCATAEL